MEKLLFTNETGAALYEKYAKTLPIIDFHCHLQPKEILEDREFEDLGEIWLAHDHYKWRCMRTFGIDERLITGDASFEDKFIAFAGIMPMLVGNPVYGWCQLELARYFGINEPLNKHTAKAIYDKTKAMIKEKRMSPRYFIDNSNVEYIATTDDPADDLSYHMAIAEDASFKTKVAPAYRPDLAMNIQKQGFAAYIQRLGAAAQMQIDSFDSLMAALEKRIVFFKQQGAKVTDHGMDNLTFRTCDKAELQAIFAKGLSGEALCGCEADKYQTAFLMGMATICREHGMLMQLHIGAYRNANELMFGKLGADTGFDACDDLCSVKSIGLLLNAINLGGNLPRVMLYPINAAQFEPLAVLAAAFSADGTKAKVSMGAPWWFNDQAYGIKRQFEAAGQLYPLALSTGMVTDSRSFLSYPRHELYRRVLCDYLGELVERGEYISGEAALGEVIEAVCYKNARDYLGLGE